MYERNAIVLEKYINKVFEQNKELSIKSSYETYKTVLEEIENYQIITEEEEKVIEEFDEIASKMQTIQKQEEELGAENIEQEETRNKLFNDFDQAPEIVEKKLIKIEKIIDENIQEQKKLREKYVELLYQFKDKQQERNKCSKEKRNIEANHIKLLNETAENLQSIDDSTIFKVKNFINTENETLCDSLTKIMLENGKNEKIKFDEAVIKKAVEVRIKIAKSEAECYVISYEKLKKLMTEIDGDDLKLTKYQKNLKDITSKIEFLEVEKEYLISFLDNERMTALNGEVLHKQMMKEACKNFDGDMVQIHNLYNLLLREIAGKCTKKAYKELYNSTYLLGMEETEKSFNQEASSIRARASIGTIINANYWRIEGIKNIYEVFNYQVEAKYGRDLTEFMPQPKEADEDEEQDNIEKFEFDIEQEYEEDNEKSTKKIVTKRNTKKIEKEVQEIKKAKVKEQKEINGEQEQEEWFISSKEEKNQFEKNDMYYDDVDEIYEDDYEDYEDEYEDDVRQDIEDEEEDWFISSKTSKYNRSRKKYNYDEDTEDEDDSFFNQEDENLDDEEDDYYDDEENEEVDEYDYDEEDEDYEDDEESYNEEESEEDTEYEDDLEDYEEDEEDRKDDYESEQIEREEIEEYIKNKTKSNSRNRKRKKDYDDEKSGIFDRFFKKNKNSIY